MGASWTWDDILVLVAAGGAGGAGLSLTTLARDLTRCCCELGMERLVGSFTPILQIRYYV